MSGRRRLALVTVALLAAVGCGAGTHPATTPVSRTDQACGADGAHARAIRFRTSDGVSLYGSVSGSGAVGAVLIHEYPLDHCGWMPYAGYLARHGVQALAFDLRCFGQSACPDGGRGHATTDVAAAVAELRRRGARGVALVGASMGGAIAVAAAALIHPAALVDLSGERETGGLTPGIEIDAAAAARGVTAPSLFAVARADRYVRVPDMRAIARRVRSTSRRVIVLPASAGHGWDMLDGTTARWSSLAPTIAEFIRRHAAG